MNGTYCTNIVNAMGLLDSGMLLDSNSISRQRHRVGERCETEVSQLLRVNCVRNIGNNGRD